MSTYPMVVRRLNLVHRGGTKFYNLIQVTNGSGQSVTICRWGPVGKFGEVQAFEGTEASMQTKFQQKQREKQGRGYAAKDALATHSVSDWSSLTKLLTPALLAKLSAAQINLLDSKRDTSKVRDPKPPRYDEDGNFLGDVEPLKVAIDEAELERERQAEKQVENAAMTSLETWGRF